MVRILYVDDSSEPLQAVKTELPRYANMRRDAAIEIDTLHTPSPVAVGSAQVLEAIRTGRPYDLIMVDYRFDVSDDDGVTLASALREKGVSAPIAVYTLDGEALIRQQHSNFDALNLAYCDKRWNMGKLYERLRPMLHGRERQAG